MKEEEHALKTEFLKEEHTLQVEVLKAKLQYYKQKSILDIEY